MGFLNFFNGRPSSSEAAPNNGAMNGLSIASHNDESVPRDKNGLILQDVPEHIFIEPERAKPKDKVEHSESSAQYHDLDTLYRYLGKNLEKAGYDDSLMNPDSSHMEEQLRFIKNELTLLISQVKNYYSSHLRDIDHHIETRRRSGMVETVDELVTHKANIQEKMGVVVQIEADARDGKGLAENLMLSYKKGFRNAFAAITATTILNKR